jgi:pSer/pThr/pTyr-binding forkhead associated (FHA) protein
MGYGDIQAKMEPIRKAILEGSGENQPALHLVEGNAAGKTFLLKKERISIGRIDPDFPSHAKEGDIALPVDYAAVTRITKPHALIIRSGKDWFIEDRGSSSGTYVNSALITPMNRTSLKNGDVIDLAIGERSARFLFVNT